MQTPGFPLLSGSLVAKKGQEGSLVVGMPGQGRRTTSNTPLCLQEEKVHADPPRFRIVSQWGKDPTESITPRGVQGLCSPEVE